VAVQLFELVPVLRCIPPLRFGDAATPGAKYSFSASNKI